MDMDKIGLCSCGKKYGTTNEMMACVRCNHGRLPGRKKRQTAEVSPSNSTELLNAEVELKRLFEVVEQVIQNAKPVNPIGVVVRSRAAWQALMNAYQYYKSEGI